MNPNLPPSRSSISGLFRHPLALLGGVLLCLAPVAARAQSVSYAGTAVNFGTVNICPAGQTTACGETMTLNFTVEAGTTVGSIGVLTQGAPNLDFTNAAGTTCTASAYSSAATCVVDVTFTPRSAGLRTGGWCSSPGPMMRARNWPACRCMALEQGPKSPMGRERRAPSIRR